MTIPFHLRNVIDAVFPPVVTKRVFPPKCVGAVIGNPKYHIYGQHNDDLTIDALLGMRKKGFYMDVGANDPDFISNTKRFYDRGWNGVNIEPNPHVFKKLVEVRTRDANVNVGLGPKNGEMNFWVFDPDTNSTFSQEQAERIILNKSSKLVDQWSIKVRTMASVMEEFVGDRHIDFMNLDVEGFEIEVMSGNDWECFRPELIAMEINNDGEKKANYLLDRGYELALTNALNGFFLDAQQDTVRHH